MEPRGTDLARRYAAEVVGPLLSQHVPSLPYAVGRLGGGSEVLGLDDATSRDHDWGLRLTLLVEAKDVVDVDALLERALPRTFLGLPTRFATTWDPVVRQRTEVVTSGGFASSRLGIDATRPLSIADWLAITGQSVLEVVAGSVFADSLPADAGISAIRDRLVWYPEDLWAVLVAVDWQRLAQELPLAGRAGERGDDLGSRVVSARLAGTAMHLGFLLERRWPPYPKWLGSLFTSLPRAGVVTTDLTAAVGASSWQERQDHLASALETLHLLQRDVGLPTVSGKALHPFFARPFVGVRDEVEQTLLGSVTDPEALRAYPAGSVEQWVEAVRVLTSAPVRARVSTAVRADDTHEAGAPPTSSRDRPR